MQHIGRRPLMAAVAIAGLVATINLAVPPPQSIRADTPANVVETTYTVSWYRGQLAMKGHAFSPQREKELTQLAEVLQDSVSAQATISSAAVEINVVTDNAVEFERRIAEFAASLPADIEIRANILPVDAEFSVEEACDSAFNEFASGAIAFEENNAVFRPSSYSRLARVAALADSCRHADVEITGHTDSSGSDDWNTSLSLQRAQAVADHLAEAGIEAPRLRVKGAGSVEPLASNATRYGRSINRRIEIEFVTD